MAVRGFEGGNGPFIQFDDGGLGAADGDLTYVAIISTDETGGSDRGILSCSASGTGATMGRSSDGVAYYDTSEIGYPDVALGISQSVWHVVAMSKAAGTSAPRLHAKEIGVGSWVHDTSPTSVTPQADSVTAWFIGAFPGGASTFLGRIAVCAVFLEELSDGDIEAIEANASTAFLASLGAVALWELNQAEVTDDVFDLIGSAHQFDIAGTYVETGDDPAWTFGLSAPMTTYNFRLNN